MASAVQAIAWPEHQVTLLKGGSLAEGDYCGMQPVWSDSKQRRCRQLSL
jgi:hypothetical protein